MLEVKNLSVYYYSENSVANAVDDVSLFVKKGETLGLLGESGSGKSTVALSILSLIADPGKIISGLITLDGVDLLKCSEKEMIAIRGAKISMIFQDPFTSLNPVFTIGDQIAETIQLHQGLNRKDAWDKAKMALELVKIDPAKIKYYPHEFSGGMKQRVMVAMALACEPEYLIADEPTTALDVTIQSEILQLIKELQKQLGFGMIFITHNFKIARQVCDRFAVMQNGKIVEEGKDVFQNPKHPYTKQLVDCMKVLYGA